MQKQFHNSFFINYFTVCLLLAIKLILKKVQIFKLGSTFKNPNWYIFLYQNLSSYMAYSILEIENSNNIEILMSIQINTLLLFILLNSV